MLYKYFLSSLFLGIMLMGCSNEIQTNDKINGHANTVETNVKEVKPSYEDILKDYEEFNHIEDTIDNIAELSIEIVEDNSNERIILFRDSKEEEAYKCIFTKKDKHLKIMQLNTNKQPLFDENI